MICFRYEDIIHCRRFTICLFSFTILVARFKICLFISPELDGYRAYIHDIDRFQLERNYIKWEPTTSVRRGEPEIGGQIGGKDNQEIKVRFHQRGCFDWACSVCCDTFVCALPVLCQWRINCLGRASLMEGFRNP